LFILYDGAKVRIISETNKKKAGNLWDSLPVTEIVG